MTETAVSLIGHLDTELREIVVLSLDVSLTASLIAFAIGAPLGAALAIFRFRGRAALIVRPTRSLGCLPSLLGSPFISSCLDPDHWGRWGFCSRQRPWSSRKQSSACPS